MKYSNYCKVYKDFGAYLKMNCMIRRGSTGEGEDLKFKSDLIEIIKKTKSLNRERDKICGRDYTNI